MALLMAEHLDEPEAGAVGGRRTFHFRPTRTSDRSA